MPRSDSSLERFVGDFSTDDAADLSSLNKLNSNERSMEDGGWAVSIDRERRPNTQPDGAYRFVTDSDISLLVADLSGSSDSMPLLQPVQLNKGSPSPGKQARRCTQQLLVGVCACVVACVLTLFLAAYVMIPALTQGYVDNASRDIQLTNIKLTQALTIGGQKPIMNPTSPWTDIVMEATLVLMTPPARVDPVTVELEVQKYSGTAWLDWVRLASVELGEIQVEGNAHIHIGATNIFFDSELSNFNLHDILGHLVQLGQMRTRIRGRDLHVVPQNWLGFHIDVNTELPEAPVFGNVTILPLQPSI